MTGKETEIKATANAKKDPPMIYSDIPILRNTDVGTLTDAELKAQYECLVNFDVAADKSQNEDDLSESYEWDREERKVALENEMKKRNIL